MILVFLGKYIFGVFINESDAILKGTDYLRILGYSQLLMCIEITVTGIFKGLGRTYIPSFVSITLNLARIPMAIFLSSASLLGLNGIWWSVTISSNFKGIILFLIFLIVMKRSLLPLAKEL